MDREIGKKIETRDPEVKAAVGTLYLTQSVTTANHSASHAVHAPRMYCK